MLPPMHWIKTWTINTLLAITSVAVMLIAAEGVLRLSPYGNIRHAGGEVHSYYTYYPYDIKPNVSTTTHTFADTSYPIWSNSLGCFDYEYNGERPYVLLVGD